MMSLEILVVVVVVVVAVAPLEQPPMTMMTHRVPLGSWSAAVVTLDSWNVEVVVAPTLDYFCLSGWTLLDDPPVCYWASCD
jgi:hypothetical protein